MDFKAIAIGFVATLVLGLVIQVTYVLIASLIGAYSISLPGIAPYKELLWTLGALFSFAITMLLGGAITMAASRTQWIFNPLIACSLVCTISLLTSLSYSHITAMIFILIPVSGVLSLLGGQWFLRHNRLKTA